MTIIKSELFDQLQSVQLIDPVTSAVRLMCAAVKEAEAMQGCEQWMV